MKRHVGIFALALSLIAITGCSDQPTSYNPDEETASRAATSHTQSTAASQVSSALEQELASLRAATSQYQDVEKAEEDGYIQATPFVPEMGFHYVNYDLLDGQIDVYSPQALVYDSNDPDHETRNLGAVEYIILDPKKGRSKESLPTPFTGQTTDDWHYESDLGFWTLHVWVWLDNPEGVFHPHNPRVGLDE